MGVIVGIFIGHFFPRLGINLGPFGIAFIGLIKMMVAPIIFCTIVMGIAKMGSLKEIGRIGFKSIAYFEIVSVLALILGLVVVNVFQPGVGLNADLHSTPNLSGHVAPRSPTTIEFLLTIIPRTVFSAFTDGNILQVLLFSLLFGVALSSLGKKARSLIDILEQSSQALFGVIGLVMKLAPLGACGAMAYSIGQYGFGMLLPLGKLIFCFLATCFIFVVFVLGAILRANGFGLWKFLLYIKEEIFIVLGTSSSEIALPRMITKLEGLGCSKSVVGLVIPTGYSFNLDGTSIYLTMASVFIAQATNTELSLYQQLSLLGVLLLTSKGAAAVPGGGFVTLATTLSTIDTLPMAGLGLLIGIDMFMSAIRSVANLIGNAVATVAISKWEKAIDLEKAHRVLANDAITPIVEEPALIEQPEDEVVKGN